MQLSVIVVSEGHHAEQWTSSSLPTAQKTPTHIPFGQKKDQIRSNCFLNNCFQPLLLQNGFFHRARRSFDRKGEVLGCSNSRPFYLSTDSCAIAAVIQYHGSNCTRVGGKCLLGDVLMRSDRNDLWCSRKNPFFNCALSTCTRVHSWPWHYNVTLLKPRLLFFVLRSRASTCTLASPAPLCACGKFIVYNCCKSIAASFRRWILLKCSMISFQFSEIRVFFLRPNPCISEMRWWILISRRLDTFSIRVLQNFPWIFWDPSKSRDRIFMI